MGYSEEEVLGLEVVGAEDEEEDALGFVEEEADAVAPLFFFFALISASISSIDRVSLFFVFKATSILGSTILAFTPPILVLAEALAISCFLDKVVEVYGGGAAGADGGRGEAEADFLALS